MFLSIIWKALAGNLSGIVDVIVGYLGKLSDNDTAKLTAAMGADKDVAIAQLQTSATVYHDRTDLLKGMSVTQWLIAGALIPPLYHSAGVYFDSCPFFLVPYFDHIVGSWSFVALPKPYDQYEWSLIGSLLGIQSALTVGMGFAKALIRR